MKKNRIKTVSIDDRLIDQRSRVFKALLKAEEDMDISVNGAMIQTEIDNYMNLIRLKKAYAVVA